MRSFTPQQLAEALEPFLEPTSVATDPAVLKAGVILSALAGCLLELSETDNANTLDELASAASLISQRRVVQYVYDELLTRSSHRA